jgi:Sulfotransferase family
LANRMSVEEFEERMLGPFFRRQTLDGPRGLHLIIDDASLRDALDSFANDFHTDRFGAARELIISIVQPVLDEQQKAGWVEMTPWNIGAAPILHRLFPEMRMVHCIRDGRDVASSVANIWWGPDDLVDGLYWWCERLRGAEAASRMLPEDVLHLVRFEELVVIDRLRALNELCSFLGIDDSGVIEFFDTQMTAQSANAGRWRKDLDAEEAFGFDGLYRAMVDELIQDRVACVPLPPDWSNDR